MPDMDALLKTHPYLAILLMFLYFGGIPVIVVLAFVSIMYWWANRRSK